jgi:hypothetical protein
MPDEVAICLERLLRTYHFGTVDPHPDSLVFAHPVTGEPLGHRLMYERLRAALKRAGLDELFAWHNLRQLRDRARTAGRPNAHPAGVDGPQGHPDDTALRRLLPEPRRARRSGGRFRSCHELVYQCTYQSAPASTELSASESNNHGAAQPTTTPPTGFESHPPSSRNRREHGPSGSPRRRFMTWRPQHGVGSAPLPLSFAPVWSARRPEGDDLSVERDLGLDLPVQLTVECVCGG